MKFGISLQNRGPLATPENIVSVSQQAEIMGFYAVFVGDHIVIPDTVESRYPYSDTGNFTAGPSGEWLEQLSLLTFVAANTDRIYLAPSVMVLPLRNPIVAAKTLATIDVLSNGRLIVGVGVGWLKEEFEALGLGNFAERGAISNEYIGIFKELWTKSNPSFQGKYCSFSNIRFEPKPLQKPHPPIWIGGESPAALRRAATLGDAWHPIGSNPRYPLKTPRQMRDSVGRLAIYAEEVGRESSEIEVAYRVPRYQITNEGLRSPFVGTSQEVADDIKAFAEAGTNYLVFDLKGVDLRESLDLMDRFSHSVLSKVDCLAH